jgi:CheY-like chemotaxis protein
MISMWEAGLRRVIDGLTALPEVLDNVPAPMADAAAEQSDVDAVVARMLGRGTAGAAPAPGSASVAPSLVTPPPAARRALPPDAPRVLVALDAREERRRVREALEEAGCAVIEAADGEAALTYARRLRPALVVAELVLPKLDGHALAQALGDDGGPPCIAFTVQNDHEALAWARECGFHAVVPAHSGPAALAAAALEALAATGRQIRLAI